MHTCTMNTYTYKSASQSIPSFLPVLRRHPDLVGDLRGQLAQLLQDGLQRVARHERAQVPTARGDDAHDHVQEVGAVPVCVFGW